MIKNAARYRIAGAIIFALIVLITSQSAEGKRAGRACYFPRSCEIRETMNGQLGLMANEDPNLSAFKSRLINRLSRAWHPRSSWDGHDGYVVLLLITIQPDGHISSRQIEKSSGKIVADEDALKALRRADCFEKMPEFISKEFEIELQFSVRPRRG